MKTRKFAYAACAALIASAAPIVPATAAAPGSAAPFGRIAVPTDPAIAAFYRARGNAPVWLRANGNSDAARQLISILRRAPLDGLSEGPALAARAEAALGRAQGGDRAALIEADRLLSAAWVRYVQAIRTPSAGMIYGDPSLAPRAATAELILHRAAAAPSLTRHVTDVARVNPVYAELRHAAWNQAQLGTDLPDRRVLANLERVRSLPAAGRYIMVDTASQRLFMIENGEVRDSMKVVVGKPEDATPMIASTIHYATFNPYWNVPADLVRERIATNVLDQGLGYLKTRRYEVLSGFGEDARPIDPQTVDWRAVAEGRAKVRVRQLPGKGNFMGDVKFGFANNLGIYLHDTPDRDLFDKDVRTFSSGCVRLEDASRLARWLLGSVPQIPDSLAEQHVQLPKGVPVFITHLTAQAEGGQLTFVDDVYRRDAGGATLIAAGW